MINMKNGIAIYITALMICAGGLMAQTYKPYTMGAKTNGTVTGVEMKVKTVLRAGNFEILGTYQPANDAKRKVIVISSGQLKKAVRQTGGMRGFASALRVAITKENGHINVSYTTPEYWGAAYFQKDYPKVKALIQGISTKLKTVLSPLGTGSGWQFGSKSGMTIKDLKGYHYMFGMPYFDDNITLHTYASYDEAVRTIDGNFKRGMKNLVKVYEVALPGQKIKLYGVGLMGPDGESNFLPTIDFNHPLHTAFLPYEMLVYKNKVYMLHGRFRIAIAFPDLSMGTFMKIVSTPGFIEKQLKRASAK